MNKPIEHANPIPDLTPTVDRPPNNVNQLWVLKHLTEVVEFIRFAVPRLEHLETCLKQNDPAKKP